MNILHIADLHTVTSNYTTGIAQVALTLCSNQNAGNDSALLGLISPNEFLQNEYNLEYLNYETFAKLIIQKKIDIVIFHSLYKLPYLKFSKLLKKKNIPYCIEFHGASTIQNASKGKFKKALANFFGFKRFIKNAASLIYLSQKEKELCVFKSINHNSIIVPNGIDSRDNVLEHKTTPSENRKIEFIYLARIDVHHKGLDLLCDALQILMIEGFDKFVHFSFYGVEKFGHYFRDRIKTLTAIADYKGPIIGETKFEAFEQSDIYILTSRYEGMPVTVLEALSCGCPCLITPQTNMVELIQDYECGWITNLNPRDIAESIKTAVSQYKNNYLKYWQNSIKASHKYEWREIIAESLAKYRELL